MGDHRCGARGSNVPLSVLVVRFDCRSRQAARGPSCPRAKSLRITRLGLASRCESMTSGEQAPEAEFRWLSREIGGGLPTYREAFAKAAAPREHIVGGRCSGPGKPSSFDGVTVEAVLVPRKEARVTECSRGTTGSVRGIHCQPCTRSTKPWHGSTARSGARPSSETTRGL